MATGTVKFFNTSKGYGFIQPEEGGTDVFVHMTALDKAGIGTLKEGQRVQFDVVKGQNGKEAADNLSLD
jgi:CspA family cold shock protein